MDGQKYIKTHHLVATTHKDGDSLGVGAALDDQHLVLGGAKRDLRACMRACVCARARARVCMCVCVCVCVHARACACASVRARLHVRVCMCTCARIRACVWMQV